MGSADMKKSIIPVLLLCLGTVFILGLWGGHMMESERQANRQRMRGQTQTTIAVVNADVGVEVDGVTQNFAAAVINTLSENFVLVSPAMAIWGYNEGTYGAMVTFPSQVSKQVLSFNAYEPERVQLEFMVNPNLPEQDYLNVYKEIVNLQQSINTMLSYTFVSSLFGQFHEAQNQIGMVFQNDMSTIDALDIIHSHNFTAGLELEQIPNIPFEPNELDTSDYLISKAEIADMISSMYLDSYSRAAEDFIDMRDFLFQLTDEFPEQKDAWMVALNSWIDVSVRYGESLSEFIFLFESHVDENLDPWFTAWMDWYDELVIYETNVHSLIAYVNNWFDDIDSWRSDHVTFLLAVEDRVDELNYRLGKLDNIPGILDDFLTWHELLTEYVTETFYQFESAFNKYNKQITEADDYWIILAGWREDLSDLHEDLEKWYIEWETKTDDLSDIISNLSEMPLKPAEARPTRPDIPVIPALEALDDPALLASFYDEVIGYFHMDSQWNAQMESWDESINNWINQELAPWGNSIYELLIDDVGDFLGIEMPFILNDLPDIPEDPDFTITMEKIDWEYELCLEPSEPDTFDFLRAIDQSPSLKPLLPPRESVDLLPPYPELDKPMPLAEIPQFDVPVPDNPLIDPPPQPDSFWSALELLQDTMLTFDIDNYMTDAIRQQVDIIVGNFGSYLDSVRSDVERHFNENVKILHETYSDYDLFLSDLRTEILQAEADGVVYLHELLEKYFDITFGNSADTQSRLSVFAGMMPESRTQVGVNQDLVGFAVLPVEAVPLAVRPELNNITESETGRLQAISVITMGGLLLLTTVIYIWIYIRRRSLKNIKEKKR